MTSELPCPTRLRARVALVTGGGSGIGRACAVALAGAGATVHVVDIDAAAAEDVAGLVGGHAHVADLADPAAIGELPAAVDVLVNSAGLQHVAPITEFPPERFTLIQQVMVTAPFLLLRHVLPHMYATRWGRVVNISSVHGLRASAYKSAYVAAKHGLEGLSKVTAIEGAPYGVTSNCISPGYVRTPGGGADPGPGRRARHRRRGRALRGAAGALPDQAADRARGGSGGRSVAVRSAHRIRHRFLPLPGRRLGRRLTPSG